MSIASYGILPPVCPKKNAFLSSSKRQRNKQCILHKETVFYLRYTVYENIHPAATVISCIRPKFVPAWAIYLKWSFEVSPVLIISYKILHFFPAFLKMKDRNLRLTQRRRPTTQKYQELHRLIFSISLPNSEVKKMESLPIPPIFLVQSTPWLQS